MTRYKQFDQLIINDFEKAYWNHPLHKHNHFELIFIARGAGIHRLNQQLLPYKKGDLFLLGPEDEHEFIIHDKTRFIYLKFTNLYLETKDVDNPSQWNKDMDTILKSDMRHNGNILRYKSDQIIVENLMMLIANEYKRNELLSKRIVFQYFKALVLLIRRNQMCCGPKVVRKRTNSIAEELFEYIELNIYNPPMLSQKSIADHFHLSSNYIGAFFKDKVGTPLKTYIQEYRYKLLEQRLKNGQVNTKQLSVDFGFTDESHLHKFVKKQSGKNLVDLKNDLNRITLL